MHNRPSGNGATLSPNSFMEALEFTLCKESPHVCLGVSASVDLEKRFCLWQPGSKAALPTTKISSATLYTEFSSPVVSKGKPAFPSAFYGSGIGPKSTHGNVVGVYGYKYEGESNPCYDKKGKWKKGCSNVETGYYGADAITIVGASSSVFISTWVRSFDITTTVPYYLTCMYYGMHRLHPIFSSVLLFF